MNNEIEVQARLNSIRENAVIAINTWWGHEYPGYSGIIVTNNKEIYTYQYYFRVPKTLKETKVNFFDSYIKKNKDLNNEEYNKIIMFIENEIVNKQFTDQMMYDAGFDLLINYNGINKNVKNNKGFGNNLGIYDKAEMLLQEYIKEKN